MAELLLSVVVVMLALVAYVDGKNAALARRVSAVEANCAAANALVEKIGKTTDLILETLLDERGGLDE